MKYKLGQRFYNSVNDSYIFIIGYKSSIAKIYECILYVKDSTSIVSVSEYFFDSDKVYLMKEGETRYVTNQRINSPKSLDTIDIKTIGVPLWTKSLGVSANGELSAFSVTENYLQQDNLGIWYSKAPCDFKIIDNGYFYDEHSTNKMNTPEFEIRKTNTTYQNLFYLEFTKQSILEDEEYSFSKDIEYFILDDYYFIAIYYYKDDTFSLTINENMSSSKGIKFNEEQKNEIIKLLNKFN